MDNPNMPFYNTYGMPMNPYTQQTSFSHFQQQQQSQPTQEEIYEMQKKQAAEMKALETPSIVGGGQKLFSGLTSNNSSVGTLKVDRDLSDIEKETKKRGPRSSAKKESGSSIEIIKPDPTNVSVEEMPSIYSYAQTTNMIHETLGQIDSLNSELMQEFEVVRQSRTLKNKYNTLVGLSENIGTLFRNRLDAIKEINSTISKANDLDYKKEKDRRIASANVDDDKYIADLYKSFMTNPMTSPVQPQMPQIDPSIFGSGIIRADIGGAPPAGNSGVTDASYLNYMSNLSPEQNLMRYEGNNNVKQVVVFDAATGNKFFQMMDISTGQVIPNVPVYDQMFMEDTTLDLQKKIAKNINLNETFPIVVINEGSTSQY